MLYKVGSDSALLLRKVRKYAYQRGSFNLLRLAGERTIRQVHIVVSFPSNASTVETGDQQPSSLSVRFKQIAL